MLFLFLINSYSYVLNKKVSSLFLKLFHTTTDTISSPKFVVLDLIISYQRKEFYILLIPTLKKASLLKRDLYFYKKAKKKKTY